MSRTLITLSALAVTMSLAACSAPAQLDPAESAEPFVESTVVVSGTGQTEVALEVPDGTESISVRVACSGGFITVGFPAMWDKEGNGACGGVNKFELPLPSEGATALRFLVLDETTFAADVTFRPDPVRSSAEVDRQCEAMGPVGTALYNADPAFEHGDLDAAGWREELDLTVDQIRDIPTTGLIGLLLPSLIAQVSDTSVVPGELASDLEFSAALQMIFAVCQDNGSTPTLFGHYGG